MQAIITARQQNELLKIQALNRLTRSLLAKELGISRSTITTVLNADTPLVVNSKTFIAVNDFLISHLSNEKED
jgi:hypothetical protein